MTPARFMFWLQQLCNAAVLDLNQPGNELSGLLASLDKLGLAYKMDGRKLRLEHEVELLDIGALRQYLSLSGSATTCQYQLVTGSTNLDVLDYFRQHQQCSIAVCEKQTDGRGRRGKRWVSPFAKNIYCTVGVLKTIQPAHLALLSIVTGLALCTALGKLGYADVKLKWPNDLYYQNKKLGGVLIESLPAGACVNFLAVGFGINVDMSADELAGIEQAATCLNLIGNKRASRNRILSAAIRQVQQNIHAFNEDKISKLVTDFDDYDALHGMAVNVMAAGQTIAATNAGIAASGQLKVETAQGLLLFSAADISLRRA